MSRDIWQYLDAAEAIKTDVESEAALLQPMLKAAWETMSETTRQAFFAHDDLVECDAAAQGYESDDPDYVRPADLKALLANAKQHGEDSEEEHEVGDLQTYLQVFEKVADGAEWESFAASEPATSVLAQAAPAAKR